MNTAESEARSGNAMICEFPAGSKKMYPFARCWTASFRQSSLVIFALALIAGAGAIQGQTIYVPNGSFESPATTFADSQMDGWQKAE
jgi:hypothetical protein